MTPRQIAFALLVVLIAFVWGAKDWVMWQWSELSERQQVVSAFVAVWFVLAVLVWALYPVAKFLM